MKPIKHLSGEWRTWIIENIERGCAIPSLVEQMVKNGFDMEFACLKVMELAKVEVPAELEQLIAANVAKLQTSPEVSVNTYVYEIPRLPLNCNRIQTQDRDVHISMRIAEPLVAIFANLLSHEECDELIRLSVAKLARSTVVDAKTGEYAVIEDRSSSGTFFNVNEDEFIAKLDRRIAEVMHMPVENGEGIQILRYGVGGEYKAHFDYFPPEQSGSQVHIAQGGQRVSTLVMYLNDVENGGETVFPELGLKVVPKKGSACYFEYCNSKGQIDPMTLHGGLPVIAGEKWIATKWMRQRKYS
jgi:prolyl 4-hydroxylase